MAEDLDQESRTEAPTQRRRDEAREQGRVAVSADLTAGAALLAGFAALAASAPGLAGALISEVRLGFGATRVGELTPAGVQDLFAAAGARGLAVMGTTLALVFAAGLASALAQSGFGINPGLLGPNWGRISPFQAEGRLLSWAKLARLLLMLLKLGAVGGTAYWVLNREGVQFAPPADEGLAAWLTAAWSVLLRLALAVSAVFVLIGLADFGWQRWKLERSLRMTRQELKEELKRDEGDPQVKARVRRMQREAAQKRMFQEVPRATVVVTNPTHLAVALRYDRGSARGPRVVAKGAGHVARRIAEMARRHAVPVLERQSLARALFKQVKLNQEIPTGLYLVVAELLAYVYRLRGIVQGPK